MKDQEKAIRREKAIREEHARIVAAVRAATASSLGRSVARRSRR
jgi:hypothetical protein